MKQTSFFLLLGCLMMACTSGSQETTSGFKYQILRDVDGEVAQPGQVVMINMEVRLQDSVIFRSGKKDGEPMVVVIPGNDTTPRSDISPIQDVLKFSSIGDSIYLRYPIDSFRTPNPKFVNESHLDYHLKVVDIMTMEELAQSRAKSNAAAAAGKPQANTPDMSKVAEGVMAKLQEIYQNYKAGALKDKITRTSSGLGYLMFEPGTEGTKPQKDQSISAHFVGLLAESGKAYDSSFERGATFDFNLGQQGVIAAWNEAFPLLNKGGSAVLFVPPHLAYGVKGYGSVPPNSELIFFVFYAQ